MTLETGLDENLRRLDVDRIAPTGLHTNMCIRHTSVSVLFRGYDIAVPSDCVDAFSEEEHEGGLDYLERVYNAQITTADELVAEWEQASEQVDAFPP